MKSLLALILCLVFLAMSGSVLAGRYKTPYTATDKEELYGTCVNMDYEGGAYHRKVIINPDGKEEHFHSGTLKKAMFIARYLITRKWSDPQENIWYKCHRIYRQRDLLALIKISNSGNTLEYVNDSNEYPTKIDPEDDSYRIYYRK